MTKHEAIELAERFKSLAEKAIDSEVKAMYYSIASGYYKEAEQYGLYISCRNKGEVR